MESLNKHHPFRQICISATQNEDKPVSVAEVDAEKQHQDTEAFRSAMLEISKQHEVHSELGGVCPHPMLIKQQFVRSIKDFNEILVIALTNIVDRWWEDKEAGFPGRMPLERHEEAVLKCIHRYSKESLVPQFQDRLGHWRPDILLTDQESSISGCDFMVCEINSRGPLNWILHNAHRQEVIGLMTRHFKRLQRASDPNVIMDSLFTLFNPNLPIHFIRGEDSFASTEVFDDLFERRTGMRPKMAKPSDLRLVPDSASQTGYSLYCLRNHQAEEPELLPNDGKTMERVQQAGLQLFHDDYRALSPEILIELAIHGVNDLRTVFLLDDKRILGIIHQELEALVSKHNVLTPEQAEILRQRIVPTILPGSPELKELISQSRKGTAKKEDFILKPCRGGRGAGHLLGENLSIQEWDSMLISMQDPALRIGRPQYIIQPFVQQPAFDLILDEKTKACQNHMVGTYYTVNGRFVGFGLWRTSSGKICSVSAAAGRALGSVVQTDPQEG